MPTTTLRVLDWDGTPAGGEVTYLGPAMRKVGLHAGSTMKRIGRWPGYSRVIDGWGRERVIRNDRLLVVEAAS